MSSARLAPNVIALWRMASRVSVHFPRLQIDDIRLSEPIPFRLRRIAYARKRAITFSPYGLIGIHHDFRAKGQNVMNNPLLKYSEELAIQTELLCKELSGRGRNANTVFQLRKSSSSVFANITEAQYPQSLADMLSKFKIARKECVETESWLKLLFGTNTIDETTFKKYRNLCGRIQRMLTASCITIEKKMNENNIKK